MGNPPQKAYPLSVSYDGKPQEYGPWLESHDTRRQHGPLVYTCEACVVEDHFMCTTEEKECYCHCNNGIRSGAIGNYFTYAGQWPGNRKNGYDLRPAAGSKARPSWISRHAAPVPKDVLHLHAVITKGRIEWLLTSRNTKVCKEPGRCVKLKIEKSS